MRSSSGSRSWPGAPGPNFRILWDNAYAVHDLDDDPPVPANLMDSCRRRRHRGQRGPVGVDLEDHPCGRGRGVPGPRRRRIAPPSRSISAFQTIGPDKVNQLRHVRFLRETGGIRALHAAPRGNRAAEVRPGSRRHLDQGLAPDGIGSWTRPRGGYFLSFETPPGLAARVVALAAEAGVKLTPAGATFPYGRDPDDTNIRIAPTYPSLDEIDRAMPVFVNAVALAAVRQRLQARSVNV